MGKLTGNWVTGAHSGRACNHEDIYTKVNKKTGACYSVKLCNPNDACSAKQITGRDAFGLVSKTVSEWIRDNKVSTASAYEDYKKVKKSYDAQTKYATLRGYMIAKGMYSVSEDKQTVTVDITKRTVFKTAFGIEDSADDSANQNQQNQQQNVTKYTLTISSADESKGTVNTSVNGQYDANSSVNIVATAKTGYVFEKWNDGDTNANRTISMTENKTLTASFKASASEENPDENAGGGGQQSGTTLE